jgi:hypothetical protein
MGTCAKSTERRQSGLLCEGSRARRSVSFKAACTPFRRILAKYAACYNDVRTHVSLGKDAPYTRQIERFGDIVAHPILAVLHHRYARI